MLSSSVKHFIHCSAYFLLLLLLEYILCHSAEKPGPEYGLPLTVFLYTLQLLPLLAVPHTLSVALGLLFFNAFDDTVKLSSSPQLAPFICFRTVTRGDFPTLVLANVARNVATCLDAGLCHFIVEVVTDKSIGSVKGPHSRQLVVPAAYKTKSGAMYKARALQYCLEPEINQLMDDDWIVHLDEETILTTKSVHGILNFINCGKYQFGQGLITYANEEVVNWVTTLADMYRVADDMGRIRGELRALNYPISGWKGSYIVALAGAERKVTFDHGLDSSIAEDAYFAMMATMEGYAFNFVEGEFWEKSAFTVMDFIRQRKRWVQGICLLAHSSKISFSTKFIIFINFYAWATTPVVMCSILVKIWCPMNTLWLVQIISIFILATTIYMYIFGIFKSISISRFGIAKFLVCLTSSVLLLPCYLVMENSAMIWGLLSRGRSFYIVEKSGARPVIKV